MRQLAECGTRTAYMRHRRRNESPCQECVAAHTKYTTEWRLKNKRKSIDSSKKWQNNNREKFQQSQKLWEEKNKDARKSYAKQWRSENLDKIRSKNRKRRALILNNEHESYTEEQVLVLYGTKCHICKTDIDLNTSRSVKNPGWEYGLHIDHLIPISKGGSDTLKNVRPSHGICNIKKGARKLLA